MKNRTGCSWCDRGSHKILSQFRAHCYGLTPSMIKRHCFPLTHHFCKNKLLKKQLKNITFIVISMPSLPGRRSPVSNSSGRLVVPTTVRRLPAGGQVSRQRASWADWPPTPRFRPPKDSTFSSKRIAPPAKVFSSSSDSPATCKK